MVQVKIPAGEVTELTVKRQKGGSPYVPGTTGSPIDIRAMLQEVKSAIGS